MRELPIELIFPRSALRATGWSDSAINRALASERLFQVRRGWLAATAADAERRAAIAAALANVGTVLSHRSAALMHGLPIVGTKAPVAELTVPPRGPGNIKHAHVHRATLHPDDIVLIDSIPVTSVARTLIDLGRHHTTACSVAAIDHALHNGLVTMAEIEASLFRCWNWPRSGAPSGRSDSQMPAPNRRSNRSVGSSCGGCGYHHRNRR